MEVGQAGEYLRSDDRVLENGYGARNGKELRTGRVRFLARARG